MRDQRGQGRLGAQFPDQNALKPLQKPIHCRECTILIGEGYLETVPVKAPDGRGYVCWRCHETLTRLADKRAAQQSLREGW